MRAHPVRDVQIIFTVELSDKKFYSQVSIPLESSDEDKHEAVTNWLQMMEMGLKWNLSEMRATFKEKDDG